MRMKEEHILRIMLDVDIPEEEGGHTWGGTLTVAHGKPAKA